MMGWCIWHAWNLGPREIESIEVKATMISRFFLG